MENLKYNIYLKLGIIFFIGTILLASTSLIQEMVHERENLKYSAISEVSSKWGNAQTISGPFISIPYFRYEKQIQEDKSVKILKFKEYVHILPESLNIKGDIKPEQRKRGIYEIIVYNSDLEINGEFKTINIDELNIEAKNILWDKAVLTTGISDLRGIENQVMLNWNEEEILFNPGVTSSDLVLSGINAKIPGIVPEDTSTYKFNFKLNLKGSQMLYFVPVGKTTIVHLESTWEDPKFNGAYITDDNKTSDEGFTADWTILHLNRNFPQMWTNSMYNIDNSAFGVDLILPVGSYQKITRSIKYAVLFIGLTFLVFFFVEVLKKVFIHPVQYILVGISLIVFYTLLLSISEHSYFNIAFIISAAATFLIIVAYVKGILKSWNLSLLIAGLLIILYSFIFVIIQMQDYALLIGSLGIFIVLALTMFFSRKVDWYAIKFESKDDNGKNTNAEEIKNIEENSNK